MLSYKLPHLSRTAIFSLVGIVVVVLGLFLTILVSRQQQKITQQAAGPANTWGPETQLSNSAGAVVVTVNGQQTRQTMEGFGSSERVFDDPHVFDNFDATTGRAATVLTTAQQNEVLDKLYSDLGLTRVRPIIEGGIEPENDNADPLLTDLSKFNFAWKRNDAHIDYVQRAKSRGVKTYFLSTINLESWMTESTDKQEYVEWAMAIIRRWREQGVDLPYYSIINEPGYLRSGNWSGEWMRDVMKLLGPKLRSEGFTTMIVVPDDVRSSEAVARARIILQDPQARQYVGALATHLYDESVSNIGQMQALANQYNLPLWMTEFSTGGMPSAGLTGDALGWADLMHDLMSTYGVSAIDYMWGFFGQWDGAQLITLNNNGAQYVGYDLKKEYYMTGQYSRFVKPGMQRIQADSSDQSLRVTAFKKESSLVIVAINDDSGAGKSVQFDLSGLGQITSLQPVRTSDTESWQSLAPIAVTGTSFGTTLPSRSVTTFTANVGESPPPTQTQISTTPSPTLTIEPTFACIGSCPKISPTPTMYCVTVACTTGSPTQGVASPTPPVSITPLPTNPMVSEEPTRPLSPQPSPPVDNELWQLIKQLLALLTRLLCLLIRSCANNA